MILKGNEVRVGRWYCGIEPQRAQRSRRWQFSAPSAVQNPHANSWFACYQERHMVGRISFRLKSPTRHSSLVN
jgi:hypothetical protein